MNLHFQTVDLPTDCAAVVPDDFALAVRVGRVGPGSEVSS